MTFCDSINLNILIFEAGLYKLHRKMYTTILIGHYILMEVSAGVHKYQISAC